MFFVMEDRDEEIAINVDQYTDSYARDTDVDELKEVRWPKNFHPLMIFNDRPLDLAPNGRRKGERHSRC